MHGGAAGSGAPTGNTNALKHGRYTAEAIARRRQLSELIRMARPPRRSERAPDGARSGREVWFEAGPSREEPNRR